MQVYKVLVFNKDGGVVRHEAKFTDSNSAKEYAENLAQSVSAREVLVYIPIGVCTRREVQWTLF